MQMDLFFLILSSVFINSSPLRGFVLVTQLFSINRMLLRSSYLFLNSESLVARLERSSFCEEKRRIKKREWKTDKLPKK